MRKQLIDIRKNLVKKLWKENKFKLVKLTMTDIGQIFGTAVVIIFRILKEEKKITKADRRILEKPKLK